MSDFLKMFGICTFLNVKVLWDEELSALIVLSDSLPLRLNKS